MEWVCTFPWMSASRSRSEGSACSIAASTSPQSSRSSGGTCCKPSSAYNSSSLCTGSFSSPRGTPAQPDVMGFGSGEVMQRGREILIGQDAQVRLQIRGEEPDGAFALPGAEHLGDFGLPAESLENSRGLGRRGDEVHVGGGLAESAHAPSDAHPDHPGDSLDPCLNMLGDGEHVS